MSLSINNNITALNAWRNLKTTDGHLSSTMEKLSSGLQINRAADDPAGLVISEKMRAQLAGLTAAMKNSEKAINMIQTAEAALDQVSKLLDKMRQLAVDSANIGVNDADMLAANQAEYDEAAASITRIAQYTQFGTQKLLNGSMTSFEFQVGANSGQTVTVTTQAVDAGTLLVENLDLSTGAGAAAAIDAVDSAVTTVSSFRGALGAAQGDNLQVQLESLRVSYENLQAAESTIRDTDMTAEMANFTKYQIMMQAGTAMLAQANQQPNTIMQLLK